MTMLGSDFPESHGVLAYLDRICLWAFDSPNKAYCSQTN